MQEHRSGEAVPQDEERNAADPAARRLAGFGAGLLELRVVANETEGLVGGEAVRLGDLRQDLGLADVAALEEVGVEQGVGKRPLRSLGERVPDEGVTGEGRHGAPHL